VNTGQGHGTRGNRGKKSADQVGGGREKIRIGLHPLTNNGNSRGSMGHYIEAGETTGMTLCGRGEKKKPGVFFCTCHPGQREGGKEN